jgi:uncharacterized membrane protein
MIMASNCSCNVPARAALWLARHWLALVNSALAVFATLPVVEPLLRTAGIVQPADAIFDSYTWVCHQLPSRSYEIAGQQMAYCERNTAIYGTMALCGLLWARFGQRAPRLHWALFLAMVVPMALDGFTQLAELRESTWQLRTLTGALFGLACVWFGFPLLERNARLLRISVRLLQRPVALAKA